MSTRRISVALTALTIIVLGLTACASPPTAAPTTAPAVFITVTDDAGRQVTLKGLPTRIVSLAPSNTEVLYALGLGDRVVGVTEYCDYPPEAKQKPKIGGFANIDLEKVIGLDPDLVLATSIHAKTVVSELEKRGITVVVVEPKNVDDVLAKIAFVGKLTGTSENANKLTTQLKSRIDAVTGKVATAKTKPRVFYEIDKTLFTPGPGSFIDDMITKAGGRKHRRRRQGRLYATQSRSDHRQRPPGHPLGRYELWRIARKCQGAAGLVKHQRGQKRTHHSDCRRKCCLASRSRALSKDWN